MDTPMIVQVLKIRGSDKDNVHRNKMLYSPTDGESEFAPSTAG